jgi:predicted Zn-dependent peptidase
MQIIRDELGLTYGIGSGLYGISTYFTGHWQVAVTLSAENLERGVEETTKEMRRFVEEGVTEPEIEEKKTTIVGGFKVGLATTSGLAGTLLRNAEHGFDVGYLDRFPLEVESVTLEQARDVVKSNLDPDKLQIAMAGVLPHTMH